jgi:CHAD domain-containing protein
MNRFVRIKQHKLLLPNDRKLHRIRREIKELAYLFNIWAKADPTAEEIKLMYQQLIQKQELIGNWHDQLNKLEAVKDLNVSPAFLEEQQQLQSQLKQQAVECLDDLASLMEGFEGMRM